MILLTEQGRKMTIKPLKLFLVFDAAPYESSASNAFSFYALLMLEKMKASVL